jgi:hypothetical protein
VAAGGIAALLTADSFLVEVNLGYSAGALLVFGLTGAAGLSATGNHRVAWIGWLCVAVAVVGLGLSMGALWSGDEYGDSNEGLVEAAGSLFVFSLALALVCLIVGRMRPGGSSLARALLAITVVGVLATATLLTIAIVWGAGDELYFRITAVVAVLATLGTAMVALVRAMERPA